MQQNKQSTFYQGQERDLVHFLLMIFSEFNSTLWVNKRSYYRTIKFYKIWQWNKYRYS